MPVHPADLITKRMQTQADLRGRSLVSVGQAIVHKEGASALYSGLSAALARQAVYTTLRLGLYDSLKERLPDNSGVAGKLGAGLVAGGIASFLSNPIEISMVRLYVDGSLPPAQRRGYTNIYTALSTIARTEGVATLWRGAQPTVLRSCMVNAVQLGVYDVAKESLFDATGLAGVPLHLAASTTSGFCYSVATLPVDNCKSRMQAQSAGKDGKLPYTSIPQAIVRVSKEEGLMALYRGFPPYFLRCAGHTVGMFLALEQLKKYM